MPESLTAPRFFPFDHAHAASGKELAGLLGGKGASLAEMTRALGFSVPAGFTIPVSMSRTFQRDGGLPEGFAELLDQHVEQLGRRMGRRFGDAADPLLVAVRSGAMISMPGMLDTVLNVGLNDETVEGLARVSGDPAFAWDCYRRFLRMYATTVLGLEDNRLGPSVQSGDEPGYRQEIARIRSAVREQTSADIPADPRAQLRETVIAVFNSWNSARAKAYRARENIAETLGTAVNVQAMVFGNRAGVSGAGVVFTRNPSTGEACLYGDYLPHAQGEDVVSGVARTLPIQKLAELAPEVFEQLRAILRRLETHYRDLCDVEFTVESGRLWLLQTRAGKRSAAAAVRIAAELARDPEIKLSVAEAAERTPAELRARARAETLASARSDDKPAPLACGLGVSPGRASGAIALDSDAAIEAEGPVILVRPHTSPEDVAGMSAAAGILTATGGLVSHAAVVAREWGTPAVVGAREVEFEDDRVRIAGVAFKAGDVLTIDGETGEIWRGEIGASASQLSDEEVLSARLPELAQLEAWLGAT